MPTSQVNERTKESKQRPYFIWWAEDITEQDIRHALASDNLYRRITLMSYILNDAEFDDGWNYLSLRDIQKHFWQIRWRTPQLRDRWKQLLTLMDYPPDECADPVAARVLE
ncbi:MAG TPA: hypothetical protein VJG32_12255 [Anaerolineae bacterium]|nr:hypothetical protein [Anaerolineae bacterium]